jgi:branched-chain amino acid transport system permease protein
VGQTVFGSDIYKIDVGMPKDPIFVLGSLFDGGVLVDPGSGGRGHRGGMVALLALFFQKTTGRALRAWPTTTRPRSPSALSRIWVIVWCVAGVAALVAGMIWGSKLGVQFSLSTLALRCPW